MIGVSFLRCNKRRAFNEAVGPEKIQIIKRSAYVYSGMLSTYLGFVQKAYSTTDTFSESKCQDTMTHNIYSFLIGILQTI